MAFRKKKKRKLTGEDAKYFLKREKENEEKLKKRNEIIKKKWDSNR